MKSWLFVGLVVVVSAASAVAWFGWLAPKVAHTAVIRDRLNDPESARFRNAFRGKYAQEQTWCGEFNARNRMGGMAGFRRYIVLRDSATVYWEETGSKENDPEVRAAFDRKWDLFCR